MPLRVFAKTLRIPLRLFFYRKGIRKVFAKTRKGKPYLFKGLTNLAFQIHFSLHVHFFASQLEKIQIIRKYQCYPCPPWPIFQFILNPNTENRSYLSNSKI